MHIFNICNGLCNTTEFNLNARFNYAAEDVELYFDSHTYQELIALFKSVKNAWKMKIFDKDGNQLICSEGDGSIACVMDADVVKRVSVTLRVFLAHCFKEGLRSQTPLHTFLQEG